MKYSKSSETIDDPTKRNRSNITYLLQGYLNDKGYVLCAGEIDNLIMDPHAVDFVPVLGTAKGAYETIIRRRSTYRE
jgi:hypothetical protein